MPNRVLILSAKIEQRNDSKLELWVGNSIVAFDGPNKTIYVKLFEYYVYMEFIHVMEIFTIRLTFIIPKS